MAAQLDRTVTAQITKKELLEATRAAQNKLRTIIKAEGDADGMRLEDWYLDELIAEEVRNRRMGAFTLATAQLFAEMDTERQKSGRCCEHRTAHDN